MRDVDSDGSGRHLAPENTIETRCPREAHDTQLKDSSDAQRSTLFSDKRH